MKKTLTLAFALVALASAAQQKATVIFMRDTGYNWGGTFRVFIDENLVCKIHNKKYSIHELEVGEHSFIAQINDDDVTDKSKEQQLKIKLEPGKTYYLALVLKTRFFADLFLQEVTELTWKQRKDKMQLEANCK